MKSLMPSIAAGERYIDISAGGGIRRVARFVAASGRNVYLGCINPRKMRALRSASDDDPSPPAIGLYGDAVSERVPVAGRA
jgi:hypothetical protein